MNEFELFLTNMKQFLIGKEGLTLIGCFTIVALGSTIATYLLQNSQVFNIKEYKKND